MGARYPRPNWRRALSPRPRFFRPNDAYYRDRASRYSRYDGDRRSRSPGDRSTDRYERNSQYGGDNDRRRSSAEARSNVSAYQNNRDAFRGDLPREPPRGPKALIDPPSGPRGGGHTGDYRGRGRARGRGWARDSSRDRTRDRDLDFRDRPWDRDDFRDRRDNAYRGERSRERDRDRDWRDPRDARDSFRGRRPSPGRGRSPPPLRDFRDREPPLAVDPDRSRRGSRDGGPPSAGSSNSDPPFLTFRGGFRGRDRGRGWGDRGRGRGGGGYYEDRDRDRFGPRSRSQEGRWGRDRDDRDRGDRMDRGDRWADPPDARRDIRDDREGPRELFRAKLERAASSSAPSPINNKDVSPPPLAPSAPAFGSVPTRNTGPSESSSTAKPPPTGPRAFNADRPTSEGQPGPSDTQGPKPQLLDGSPPIPIGPRSQQQKQQRPSSKQWINPALAGKKAPDSPKLMRSQSFAQQQRPFDFHPDSGRADQPDYERRPRSSGAKSDTRMGSPDLHHRDLHGPEPGEISENGDTSLRGSVDRESKPETKDFFPSSVLEGQPAKENGRVLMKPEAGADTSTEKPSLSTQADAAEPSAPRLKQSKLRVPIIHFSLPPREPQAVSSDEPSESDDDEDYGEYFATEIAKEEAALEQLQGLVDDAPDHAIARYARVSHEALVRLVSEPESLVDMLGPIPKALKRPEEDREVPPAQETREPPKVAETSPKQPSAADAAPTSKQDEPTVPAAQIDERQPKTEEMEIDGVQPALPGPPEATAPPDRADVPMQDSDEANKTDAEALAATKTTQIPPTNGQPLLLYPPGEPIETIEKDKGLPSTPSQVEDDEDGNTTESDDLDPMILDIVRDAATPPPDSLPDFACRTWNRDKDFLQTLDSDPLIDDFISKELGRVHLIKSAEQDVARQEYATNYAQYLHFTLSNDPAATRSREKFVSNPPPPDPATIPPPPEPKPEGRGTNRRYASERDLERILQESKREEEERKERELRAQQDRFRSDKEAVPPEMFWNSDELDNHAFVDTSGLVSVEQIASTWHLLPPINNFSEAEAERFEKGYLESIKQWGVIAEGIENRDFKTCIQYYYLMKKELNLKEKLKKQPKRRKKGGRAKTRSSALVSELGNAENENEESQETGENGERRRPRRAAAPTWGYEQPPTDSDNATPAGTPGRRSAKGGDTAQEKPDGRKGRRRAKDKEPKAPKGSALVPGTTGKGRSRSNSRVPNSEPQPQPLPPSSLGDNRLAVQSEMPPGVQPPFMHMQPQQPLQQGHDRVIPIQNPGLADVMAPPSLRPEPPPPPQPSVTTFDLGQPQPPPQSAPQPPPQPERRAHVQPSSYWSVSETDVFPGLLQAFGSDWQAMAAHMGSKTAVMVKNYYVRQRDSNRPEWGPLLQEADAKKARGEKRPDPPPPPTQTGRKKYDSSSNTQNRPLASASRDIASDVSQTKLENGPGQPQNQPYGRFAVPIAPQAPSQQPIGQGSQQPPMAMPPHGMTQPPVTQALSPTSRPLRAPLQTGFGYPEREREPLQSQPPVRISQKPPVPEHQQPRPLAAAQPLQTSQPGHPEQPVERQKLELQQPKDHHRSLERTRLPTEPESGPHHPYEPFSLHQRSVLGGPSRGEPLPPPQGRPPHEPPRGPLSAPPPFSQPVSQQGVRGLLSDPPQTQTTTPPAQRPISAAQRQMSSHLGEPYPPRQQSPPASATAPPPSRPAQERKTSNLMSLLNDDPPPRPSRASEPTNIPPPTSTPTPGSISRAPPGAKAPIGLELRPENSSRNYMYGDSAQPPPSGMPQLKPSYTASPQTQHLNPPRTSMASPHEAASALERDYYRYPPHQQHQPPPSSGSPPAHHYPAPSHPSREPYQGQGAYPPYGGPTSHAASPPPSYAAHQPGSRSREPPPPSRETAWPPGPQGHGIGPPQQPPAQQGGWPGPHGSTSKQGQPPPPQQSTWASPHGSSGKPPTPVSMSQQPSWAPPPQQQQPPPQPHHLSLRDDRGPPMYSQPPPQHQHQHSISGRFPSTSRAPEPIAPQAQQSYPPRYASTPGPRDPRDQIPPPRSYTPVSMYDTRPAPPQQTNLFSGHDMRSEASLRPGEMIRDPRDMRDPREVQQQQQQQQQMMGRQLRPHDGYDRPPPDRYGR